MARAVRRLGPWVTSLLLLAACGEDDGPAPVLSPVSGDGQVWTVASFLPQRIFVRVTKGGEPAYGVAITWTTGDGHVVADAKTDLEGLARASWFMPERAGPALLTVSAEGGAGSLELGATATPGAPAQLAFTLLPDGGMSGRLLGAAEVATLDGYGNPTTGPDDPVTVALRAGTGTAGAALTGTTTARLAAGVARFPYLRIDRMGKGYRLEAASGALLPAVSPALDVGPELTFAALPSETSSGTPLGQVVQVTALDAGAPVAGATVRLSVAPSCPAASPVGAPEAVTSAAGKASFDGVALQGRGAACRLLAGAAGYAGAGTLGPSDPFDVLEVDQEQAALDPAAGVILGLGDASAQRLAQAVKVRASGELVGFRLPVTCSAGWLEYSVQGVTAAGLPDGATVAAGKLHAAELAASHDTLAGYPLLRLALPRAVAAGASFALVLSATQACGVAPGPAGDPYAGGDAAFDALPGAGWRPLGNPPRDLPFQSIMR